MVAEAGRKVSELGFKLKSFKIEPQTKDQALANIRKLKADVGMANVRSSQKEVSEILKRAGSLTDEVLAAREKDRA